MYCRIEFLIRTTSGSRIADARICQRADDLGEMIEIAERYRREHDADGFRLYDLHTGARHEVLEVRSQPVRGVSCDSARPIQSSKSAR